MCVIFRERELSFPHPSIDIRVSERKIESGGHLICRAIIGIFLPIIYDFLPFFSSLHRMLPSSNLQFFSSSSTSSFCCASKIVGWKIHLDILKYLPKQLRTMKWYANARKWEITDGMFDMCAWGDEEEKFLMMLWNILSTHLTFSSFLYFDNFMWFY